MSKLLRHVFAVVVGAVLLWVFLYISQRAYVTTCPSGTGVSVSCSAAGFLTSFGTELSLFIKDNNESITAIATLMVALFTFTLWRSTDKLSALAKEQGQAMEKSTRESERAANAMERTATTQAETLATMKQRTAQQMRAYISPVIGHAYFQQAEPRQTFEVRPVIVNNGFTPARHVRWKVASAILNVPLPADFTFPLPEQFVGDTALGPRQDIYLRAFAPGHFTEDQALRVRTADGLGLYCWGVVKYEDIVGNDCETKFCQQITIDSNNNIVGSYIDRHNDAL